MSADELPPGGDAGERPETPALRAEDPGRDARSNGERPDQAGEAKPGRRWDGNAAQLPGVDGSGSTAQDKEPTDEQDDWGGYDQQQSKMREKIPESTYIKGSYIRDVVSGEVHHHYYQSRQEQRGPGRVPVTDLLHASYVHVRAASDPDLNEVITRHRVAFCRGAPGTGRTQSATVVLDRLTGYDRTVGKVIVLDATTGLAGLPGQLEAGCGHLLDGTEARWADSTSRAQLNQFRAALGPSGFLVILLGADDGTPLAGPAVNHIGPAGQDLGTVAAFHLAVQLLSEDPPPDRETLTRARKLARTVIEEARQADDKTRDWFEELTHASTATPAEAVLFADVISDWHRRRLLTPDAEPRVAESRARLRYMQAASLLRRSDAADSPLRQSFALSAAVLDGLALSEVIDGAAALSALLAEVEHPGEPGQRDVFAQPLVRWLRHVEMAAPQPGAGNRDSTVLVKMPSRELARAVIELAWREYDAVRTPVLQWLMNLAALHGDDRVRIRAVQALAYIAAHDYRLIKLSVLDKWSEKGSSRFVEHLAASWLLEAIVLDGAAADKVTDLLWAWARKDATKRMIAVRAYGTAIAPTVPDDAILGVRISAVFPVGVGTLPEAALCEMYRLGLTEKVTAELAQWRLGFPVMRERAGRALVRISQFRRVPEGESNGPYDLLWLLAHEPGKVGASMTELAEVWLLACSHENDALRGTAWRMLGRWAKSCSKYPGLGYTFSTLADEFEKAAAGDDLRGRLRVYRRRWNRDINEETEE